MIKKLSIVFAALLAVMSIHAQDEKPRHEIGVSYGLGVSLIGDGIGNAIGTGIFEIGFPDISGRIEKSSEPLV